MAELAQIIEGHRVINVDGWAVCTRCETRLLSALQFNQRECRVPASLGTETAREEDPLRPFFCADTGSLTEAEKAIHSKYQDTDPDGDYFDPAPVPSPGAPDEVEALASVVCQHHAGSRIIGKGVSIPHMSDGETFPCQSCRAVARAVLSAGYLSPAQVAEAQAQALREAAHAFQVNTWADVITPALKTEGIPALAVGQAVVDWLRARADRLTREAGAAAEAGPDCWPGFDR